MILKSVDPAGVEQVRIEVDGLAGYHTHVVANVKNLEALGGGAPMVYVRAYVDVCAGVRTSLDISPASGERQGRKA